MAGVLDEIGKLNISMPDRALAFVLGSGASSTSGIPTGKTMAENWLNELHQRECLDGSECSKWVATGALDIDGLAWENAAEFYPQIFERRFRGDPASGFASLEAAMEGKEPSLGYSLLAEIMQQTMHKVVVTTNFDNLVADALAIHAHKPPLIVGHESLTGFVRPLSGRPLVAKIHRDLLLHPKNDEAGISTLERGWHEALSRLFKHYTPLVIGYGGNDGSLMGFLHNLQPGEINGRIFWCYRAESPPSKKVSELLVKHNGVMVAIPGFDEFMLQLAAKLISGFDMSGISERIQERGKKRAASYREQAEELQKNLAATLTPSADQQATRQVLIEAFKAPNNWWSWEMLARNEVNPEKRDHIYRKGLAAFPTSAELTCNYALFLSDILKDFDAAEAMYKRALELDPSDADYAGNYALFLSDNRKDFKAAEIMYKKALEINSNNAIIIASYANFLNSILKKSDAVEADAVEAMYKKALELDSNQASTIGNYASFLSNIRKDYEAAETMYKKALKLDPNNVNIACNWACLQLACGRPGAAGANAQQVVKLSGNTRSQATAEALLYLALINVLEGRTANNELGRLKSLLHAGYEREDWSFDSLFAATLSSFSPDNHTLYKALGAAILDEKAIPDLEQNTLWQQVKEHPWFERA